MARARFEAGVPTRDEWAALWRESDTATFFHSPDWAELWSRFDPATRSVPELLRFEDGRRALLPLCFERRLGGLLGCFTACPQATFGGWITSGAIDEGQADALLAHLLERGSSSLVWRMNPYDAAAFDAGRRRGLSCRADYTHAIELSPGADALAKRFKNGYRSDIRKALKTGRISVEPATRLEEWRAYYRVYQETLSRWGHQLSEGYPWELFELLAGLNSPVVRLWLARYDGVIVSGELCLYARRHVVSWHAATLQDYLRSHVAKVQIFHVIQDACARGYRWFDFNPSAGLEGVRTFKESFDAQPLPAPLVYVDAPVKRLARSVAARLNVPYARLDLMPLTALLAPIPAAPPANDQSLPEPHRHSA
jgi:CelD/BcsL family acetyltransferase involved in cellulose biosynthesis